MLSDSFLTRLDALALRMRHPAAGGAGGLRRSKALGSSVEFSDFREYAEGDDLRRVDWNAYARLDKLLVKLFMEEQEQRVNVVVDASASMAFGAPAKWDMALKLAQTLCYLALAGGDRVTLFALTEGGERHTAPLAGRQHFREAAAFLEGLTPSGAVDVETTLTLPLGRGMTVLLSDFLWEQGYERAIRSLLYRKQEVCVLQIWSREEWEPTLEGEHALTDSETQQVMQVDAGYELMKQYRDTATAYVAELRAFLRKSGAAHGLVIPQADAEAQLIHALSRAGLIG